MRGNCSIVANLQIDKCPRVGYNSFKFFKEVTEMTACFKSMQPSVHCGNSAAAGSSARAYAVMDTAILAVSIIIFILARLLVLGS